MPAKYSEPSRMASGCDTGLRFVATKVLGDAANLKTRVNVAWSSLAILQRRYRGLDSSSFCPLIASSMTAKCHRETFTSRSVVWRPTSISYCCAVGLGKPLTQPQNGYLETIPTHEISRALSKFRRRCRNINPSNARRRLGLHNHRSFLLPEAEVLVMADNLASSTIDAT